MNYIQQFCWPDIGLIPEVELYARVNDFAKKYKGLKWIN